MIKRKIPLGEYPTWSTFENAVSLIRKNAEEFNAEGSDIIKDARVLEVWMFGSHITANNAPTNTLLFLSFTQIHFHKLLNESKAKLGNAENGGSGIKLRLNVGGRNTPPPPQEHKELASTLRGPRIKLNVGSRQNAVVNIHSVPALPSPPSSQQVQQPARTPKKPPVNGHVRTSRSTLEVGRNPNISSLVAVPQVNGMGAVKDHLNDVSIKPLQAPLQAPTPPTSASLSQAPLSSSLQGLSVPGQGHEIYRASQSPKPNTDLQYSLTRTGRSRSPGGESITLRGRSSPRTPQPQASPPASSISMPPPPQRHSATPGPSNHLSMTPLNVSAPIPPVLHHPRQSVGFDEPRYRADGKGNTLASPCPPNRN